MSNEAFAYVGRKGCGCPTFVALCTEKRRSTPIVSEGKWTGKGKRAKWVDTSGKLGMRRVPLDQANVVVCRCES